MHGDPAAARAYEAERLQQKREAQRQEAARMREKDEIRVHNADVRRARAAAEAEREATMRSTVVEIGQTCYRANGKVRQGACRKGDMVVPIYSNAACEEAKALAARAVLFTEKDHAASRLAQSCSGDLAVASLPRRASSSPTVIATPPPSPTVLDVTTGTVMPRVAGGAVDPKTGTFHQEVAGGFVNSKTGQFSPGFK